MPRKKKEEEIEEIEAEKVGEVEESKPPSELTLALARQEELLLLRQNLTNEKIDSIGQLDVLLGRVNQRVKELSL